jgi:hypothetical protein
MSSSKFVVKAVFGNDFRRFILREPSYDLLIKTLAQSYDLSTNFVVKYPDDEGDLCLVSSDVELVEAFHVAASQKNSFEAHHRKCKGQQTERIQALCASCC